MEQASWGRSPTSPTCQRMFPMHSTRATIRLARPILPAPDCIRCTARYAEVRYHSAPSDHRIRLAKTAARFYPGWRLACRALVFFTACYFPQQFVGLQQNMHMVRHHYPCEELIQPPFPARDEQGLRDRSGYLWMFEERGSRTGRVQLPVQQEEPSAFGERVGYHGVIGTRQRAI